MARYSAVFVHYLREIGFLKLNLMPKAPIEKFWDALWLGIRPFSALSCKNRISKIEFDAEGSDREILGGHVARHSAVFLFYVRKIDFLKLNLMPKAPIEKFWDTMWLGIRPLFCFIFVKPIF